MKPQVPNEIKKPKFKDTEGLGHTIPIENIGAIAGTIATGGIGGIAAVEALLTGGLTGLATAGENTLGSAIGGGIGAGVNSALGGGDMGHYVSSVIGGAVGRTAAGRTRPRASERTEPFTGRGHCHRTEIRK